MKRAGPMMAALGFLLFAQVARADWTPTKRITWTEFDSFSPAIAVDSKSYIHVVWQDQTNPEWLFQICHKKSTDGGTTWSTGKRLTWTPIDFVQPSMAIDSSDSIHVVCLHYSSLYFHSIYYKKSTDGGATWSADRCLVWTPPAERYWPSLAIDSSDHIYLVWYDAAPGYSEIYFMKSTNGGTSWSSPKRLTWTPSSSYVPAIAVDSSDIIHVVWYDYTPGNWEVYYKRSTDGGISWSTGKRLTWTSGSSNVPQIAIDSSKTIHIVWQDDTAGNYEIYHKRSTDGGTSWSTGKRLTWTSGTSTSPQIAIDSGKTIHVVWQDDTPGNYELYHKRSTDAGAAWSVTKRLSWNAGVSINPAMAIDSSDAVHVVWNDRTPGNSEIFYKKRT